MINCSNITTIYVSQKNGDDRFSGFCMDYTFSFQGPLKTIEKALYKVAELRRIGANQPISIIITDDIYYVNKPIKIDNTVSAVTIKSLNKTVISGGFKIEGFKEDIFNGKECFSADVPMLDEGIWFTDLYVDGRRADFTHYPKEGTLKPERVENESTALHTSSKWFIAKPEEIKTFKNFSNFSDCFISYNHFWVDEHSPIESYDEETGKVVFSYASRYAIELTHPAAALEYIVENVAEAFENKNEWYLDRQTKKVYYIPRNDAQTPESIEVYAPLTDKLFVVSGEKENKAERITFSNLTFAYTKGDYKSTWIRGEIDLNTFTPISQKDDIAFACDGQSMSWAHGTVEFYHSHACTVENCEFRNLGVHALDINTGSSNIRILNNAFYDIGAGAVKINGSPLEGDPDYNTHNITIHNNTISECGKRYFCACGILSKHSYENIISNNTISYLYYTGISVGWVWGYKDSISHDHIIENNHIHHIGQGKLSDMGGIYLLGKNPGTIVRNNLIHDVESKHYGGWGIYTDEGSSYVTIEKNICYNIACNDFHQHYGCMNTIRNNIFAKSKMEPVRFSKIETHIGGICEKNIIVSEELPSYTVGYYLPEESGSFHIMSGSSNLHYCYGSETYIAKVGEKNYTLEEFQNCYGFEDGSIIADPMFKDYKNNDYTLLPESPAFKMGFEAIDMSDVGARR